MDEDTLQAIERLASLYESGVLTDTEFTNAKSRLISSSPGPDLVNNTDESAVPSDPAEDVPEALTTFHQITDRAATVGLEPASVFVLVTYVLRLLDGSERMGFNWEVRSGNTVFIHDHSGSWELEYLPVETGTAVQLTTRGQTYRPSDRNNLQQDLAETFFELFQELILAIDIWGNASNSDKIRIRRLNHDILAVSAGDVVYSVNRFIHPASMIAGYAMSEIGYNFASDWDGNWEFRPTRYKYLRNKGMRIRALSEPRTASTAVWLTPIFSGITSQPKIWSRVLAEFEESYETVAANPPNKELADAIEKFGAPTLQR